MRGTALKLTVFTLFTIAVTFWLGSIIGNISPFAETYAVQAVFSDATGVLVGDPVKIAGVTVGKVTGFEVEDNDAVVDIQLEGDVEVPTNVIAEIKYRNLIGQRMVNLIRPSDPASDILQDGGRIPVTNTRPALDLSVVFNNLRPLIQTSNPAEINAVARATVAVFKGREEDLASILGNFGTLSKTLAAGDQRLARMVSSLNDLTRVLNSRSNSIRTGLNRFTEVMEALAEVTPELERVIDQVDDASSKFGNLIARNRGNLTQELADLAVVLDVLADNLAPLDRVAKNLKEVLLATARSQSYGRWWNLYVVNLCPEGPVCDVTEALPLSSNGSGGGSP
jgi:phospholipid/cholesterol/gamma-HCH transport system substrate-binding protein